MASGGWARMCSRPAAPVQATATVCAGGGKGPAHLVGSQGQVVVDEQQVGHSWLALGGSGFIREADAIVRAVDRTIQLKE
jgi:hypothetical protein